MQIDIDITIGIIIFGATAILSASAPGVAGLIFTLLAAYFFMTGLNREYSPRTSRSNSRLHYYDAGARSRPIPPTSSAPITDESTIAERIRQAHVANGFKCPNCGATIENATDRKCRHCDSILVDMSDMPKPEIWADVEIGQSVRIKREKNKDINAEVVYRLYYGELWQEKMTTSTPWTLTGNYYTGLGLNNDMYLLNWQSRYYLLDTRSALTDTDINRDFAAYAREFAASNQTRNVMFSYDGTRWKMIDIGRFRIEYTEGPGAIANSGAIGRFIHARADDRILVVEDFQSGGSGRDTLWTGDEISKKDITLQ